MSDVILEKARLIYQKYQNGELGDTNPGLDSSSNENVLYFTLPMALNSQRNSYTLWESALKHMKILKRILSFHLIRL